MTYFLRVKPLLLFLLLYGLPLLLFISLPVEVAIYAVVRLAWIWSVGVGLHRKLPPEVKLNVTVFKIAFMIPVVDIILCGIIYIAFLFLHIFGVDDARSTMDIVFPYLVPLHFLAILGFFYSLWFNSRVINSIEQKKLASISDCLADFFAIWFFIVGVWLVQGRVNKIANESEL